MSEPGAYVYMLRCADGSYYVGSARLGLDRRISEHNEGLYGDTLQQGVP
jgi:putative endonuclease